MSRDKLYEALALGFVNVLAETNSTSRQVPVLTHIHNGGITIAFNHDKENPFVIGGDYEDLVNNGKTKVDLNHGLRGSSFEEWKDRLPNAKSGKATIDGTIDHDNPDFTFTSNVLKGNHRVSKSGIIAKDIHLSKV